MAKRVQAEAQKEYKKELDRLLRIIRKGEQEGYIFPDDVVPRLPKHVTQQQLEDIKRIRKEDLYEVASFVDRTTGEIIEPKRTTIRTRKPTTKAPRKSQTVSSDYIPHPRIKKPKPETLTDEQRKAIRSQAGKKAWATRAAKMKAEGTYDEYIRAFVERTHKPVDNIPVKSAIESVSEELQELSRYLDTLENSMEIDESELEDVTDMAFNYPEVWSTDTQVHTLERNSTDTNGNSLPYIPIEGRKSMLIEIWQETLARNEDNLLPLEEYLIENRDAISEAFNKIRTAWYEDVVDIGVTELGKLLNQGALSAFQAEGLSRMSEYSEVY